MNTNAKRHFLDCRSLAEMAITLVVVNVILILPVSFVSVFLGFVLGLSKFIALFVPLGLWLLSIFIMWWRFVQIARSWSEPKLASKEFSYFQWASTGFVLLLTLAFRSAEVAPAIDAVRWFLAGILIMANLAYVSLAFMIRAEVPAKIYFGLMASIAVALLTIWAN